MKFKLFKDKLDLSKESLKVINAYAKERDTNISDALEELIRNGYHYYELKKAFGTDITSREIWDKRFYFLKVESLYVYYRLRLKDVVDELKTLIIRFLATLSELEMSYKTMAKYEKNELIKEGIVKIKEEREFMKKYFKEFIESVNKDVNDKRIDDKEVIKSIEEILRRYKKRSNSV